MDRAKKVDIGPTFSAVTGLDEFKKACKGAYSKRDVDLPERDRISL